MYMLEVNLSNNVNQKILTNGKIKKSYYVP